MFTNTFLDTLASAPGHREAAQAAAAGHASDHETAADDWLRHIRALNRVDAIEHDHVAELDQHLPHWRRATPRQLDAEHANSSLPAPPATRGERLGLTPAQWLRIERIAVDWPNADLEDRDRRYLMRMRTPGPDGGDHGKPGMYARLDRRLPGWRTRDLSAPRRYPAVVASYIALAQNANLASRGATTTMWLTRARDLERRGRLAADVADALDTHMPGWRTKSASTLDQDRRDAQLSEHGPLWLIDQIANEGPHVQRPVDRERLRQWRRAEIDGTLDTAISNHLDDRIRGWRDLGVSIPQLSDAHYLALAERGELASTGSRGRGWLANLIIREQRGKLPKATIERADEAMPEWRTSTPRHLDAAWRQRTQQFASTTQSS